MKTLLKVFFAFSILFSTFLSAQTITKSTFLVKGECGMCKDRIETTAKKNGAASASWNADTQKLDLEFDANKVSADEILKKIAEAGHDNERFSTTESVYENLPACCHYDRSPSFLKANVTEQPQKKDHEFFVRGNCSSCKARIEKAAKDAGANSANWDVETQKVTLDFNPTKTSAEKILKKIADVGHDNEKYKASDDVYKNLPGCCLYDRNLPFGVKGELAHSDEEPTPKNDSPSKADHVGKTLEEIRLVKLKEATALSKKEAGLTYNIGSKELLKAACCNLSESFETNATVDVSFSNAVTGTKQLKMLGLDQKYTALTKELFPEIRGLASAYGLNFIPGRWISGIQLTKGGSTVTNGYESITGQINTEFLKYKNENESSINLFADLNLRTEANITSTQKLSEKWNQSILLHGNGTFGEADYNDDGFLDQPKGNQLNAAYLLNFDDLNESGFGSHFGINFLKDERIAGQKGFDKKLPQSAQSLYGVGIDISRIQLWNKTGYIFKGKPYQSIGWMNQFTHHEQDSFFGFRNYDGKQNTFYSNLIFEGIFGNTNHKYKTGASFLYDDFNENYLIQNYKRTETVPGIFFEYTLTGEKYTLVAGARTDFHNLAGTQFTPKINFKYDFTPKTILRLSAGRGFRTANIFAENQQYFASNRQIEILGNGGKIYDLKPEIAWNYGISLQQEFQLFQRKSTVVADFFRTDFQNQVLTDLDASPQKMLFYNLDGKSAANSFQTQWDFSPAKNFDVRLAYKYYDVQADYLSGRKEVPFMAKNRGFANFSYSTHKNDKGGFWSFDTTLNLVGKQRIPNTKSNPAEFQLPEYSNSYATLNAQIAKDFNKNIRVYLGGENLTSYTQTNPILDAKNPFGNYFDGGMVYAPIMPANVYIGIDLKF
ncbi:TonB-dependent receptor domain-containing protein [Chryseobacterium sp. R2A-55]|uniref:TonB-dependent receptor domain-containing protein n=1 Tax=Chryseobacterium sp. R2A-55 TaxID=2744445 RepID=UPI001F2C22EA|nr:TonB-dependent receptor [Chryseobacterium sp. R2A-55]